MGSQKCVDYDEMEGQRVGVPGSGLGCRAGVPAQNLVGILLMYFLYFMKSCVFYGLTGIRT